MSHCDSWCLEDRLFERKKVIYSNVKGPTPWNHRGAAKVRAQARMLAFEFLTCETLIKLLNFFMPQFLYIDNNCCFVGLWWGSCQLVLRISGKAVITLYFYYDLFHKSTKKLPETQHYLLWSSWGPRIMRYAICNGHFTHSGSLRGTCFPLSITNQVPGCATFSFSVPKPSTLSTFNDKCH